jgi:hypothetical protein
VVANEEEESAARADGFKMIDKEADARLARSRRVPKSRWPLKRRSNDLARDHQVASAEDSADGLVALNALLDLWWNERLAVFHILQENFLSWLGRPRAPSAPAATSTPRGR